MSELSDAELRISEGLRLDFLTSIAAAIAHSPDLDGVLSAALDATLKALDFEVGGIYLVDHGTGELHLTPHCRGVPEEYLRTVARFQPGEALLGRPLDAPVVIENLSAAPEARGATRRLGLGSFVFVPLYARGKVVGVMPLGGFSPRTFPTEDLRLLETVGGMLGGAIENGRLLASTQRHLEQVRALWEIDRAILEDRDLAEVLRIIAREAALLGGGDSAIALAGAGDPLTVAGSHGWRARDLVEANPRLEGQLLSALLLAQESVMVRVGDGASGPLRVLVVPLRAGARGLGGLVVVKDEAESREDDLTILATFGHQATVALAKARMRDAEGRRAGQLAVVSTASEIASSTLDLDVLLGTLARHIQRSFGYYAVAVYLVDAESRQAFLAGAAGAAALIQRGTRVQMGTGIIGWVAERGEYVLANDVSREPRFVRAGMEGTLAELAVPVRLAGEIVAVINVESDRLGAFDEGDVVALDAIAAQIGAAVRNARLFQEKVRALRTLEILQEITNVLNSELDLGTLLDRIAQRSVEAVRPAQMGSVLLYDGESLGVRSSYGYPDPSALASIRLDFHEGLPGSVFVSGQGRFVAVAPGDLGRQGAAFRAAAGGADPKSALCVPISLPHQKLGVLLLQNCSPGESFEPESLRFATTLGHQAAIAIGNALRVQKILELDGHRQNYLSNVSHELRTPLTVVQGYLEALESGAAGERSRQFVEVAITETHRLGRMIDEVLEVARLEQGVADRPIEWSPVHLAEGLRGIVRGLEAELRLKGLELTLRVLPELPPVVGDERLLGLMVLNLLENAVKFTPAGGRIEVGLETGGEDLVLTVSDSGIGIPAEYRGRVFEKFFMIDEGTNRARGGAGIGLYLAREVVAIHSGAISVDASASGGARFEVRLPLRPRG